MSTDIEDLGKKSASSPTSTSTSFPSFRFLTDAQFLAEVSRCESCELKPCRDGCPVACSPMDFIFASRSLEPSDIQRAAAEIMSMNPLGGVCGVDHHPSLLIPEVVCPDTFCMAKCVRKDIDRPVDIPALQAFIVNRANQIGLAPQWTAVPHAPEHGKIAVIGGGPAGLSVASFLTRSGVKVDLYEKRLKLGGKLNTIPVARLPRHVIEADLSFVKQVGADNLTIFYETEVTDMEPLLKQGYKAVCVAAGLDPPKKMGVIREEAALPSFDYLWDPKKYAGFKKVLIVGGGPVAVDCAITARIQGAEEVSILYRRGVSEMPLTPKERQHLLDYQVDVIPRTVPSEILINKDGRVTGLKTVRVSLPHRSTRSEQSKVLAGTEQSWEGVDAVIAAIGNNPASVSSASRSNPLIFHCGDYQTGASTVVQASATGKNVGRLIWDFLRTGVRPAPPKNLQRSEEIIVGYDSLPVPLETDFFGLKLENPFILSASPITDGYEQAAKALAMGWAGVVMKTAFDGDPILIPSEYMTKFNNTTFGNCDNVSEHPLSRVVPEIERLRKEFPTKLIAGSTGGKLTGKVEVDKASWQSNTLKLEKAGAMAVEYSLSCPQGGAGEEGHMSAIASQSCAVSARIVDWVLEVSDPKIPKIFKLSAAVTFIDEIAKAVLDVIKKYPNKKAGITLSNSFPVMNFKNIRDRPWKDGVVYGMAGEGVLPISYLTLAKVSHMGLEISGNGGVMNYEQAANFLALGTNSVQVCTLPTRYGVQVIKDLKEGLSHLLAHKKIPSIQDLRGIALPNPFVDFGDLPEEKKISSCDPSACIQCGNCTRCPYGAITMDIEDGYPRIDPQKCVGCSVCVLQCPSKALKMVPRTPAQRKKKD